MKFELFGDHSFLLFGELVEGELFMEDFCEHLADLMDLVEGVFALDLVSQIAEEY